MREILFRGKRVDNGEWVEGQTIVVIHQDDNDLIFMPQHGEDVKADPIDGNDRALSSIYGNYYQILPQTVGQYTGLVDKNGKKIFEGDIVKRPKLINDKYIDIKNISISVIDWFYDEACFTFYPSADSSDKCLSCIYCGFELEIIGNIHDNPELLEVK